MVDGSGKPEERESSSAQIRTLLEEQRQMIIAEYREKVGHHELQDKVQDRGMYLFTISYGSDAMDQGSGAG